MILSVTEFGVEPGESLRKVGSYMVGEAPNLAGLNWQLQDYLGKVASEDYHGRVTRWFDQCSSSGVITELNIGNGPHYVDRWTLQEG